MGFQIYLHKQEGHFLDLILEGLDQTLDTNINWVSVMAKPPLPIVHNLHQTLHLYKLLLIASFLLQQIDLFGHIIIIDR